MSTQTGFFFFNLCGGTLGTATTTGLLYQPRMLGEGDCGEIGGMKIGRGNRRCWNLSPTSWGNRPTRDSHFRHCCSRRGGRDYSNFRNGGDWVGNHRVIVTKFSVLPSLFFFSETSPVIYNYIFRVKIITKKTTWKQREIQCCVLHSSRALRCLAYKHGEITEMCFTQ
jgi:hypothetical protein